MVLEMSTKEYLKSVYKFKWILMLFVLMNIIIQSFTIINPYLLGKYIDGLEGRTIQLIKISMIGIIGVLLVSCILEYILELISTSLSIRIDFDFRSNIYDSLHRIDINYLEKKKYDYITSSINTDVNIINGFLFNYIMPTVFNIIRFIALLCLMLLMNTQIAFIQMIIFSLNLLVYYIFKNKLYRYKYAALEKQNQFYADQNNMIYNLRNIRRNAWFDAFNKRINNSFENYYKTNYKSQKMKTTYSKVQLLLKLVSFAVLLYLSSNSVLKGELSIGQFTVFMTYYNSSYQIILGFLTLGSSYQEYRVARQRLADYFERAIQNNGTLVINKIDKIELINVNFNYDNTNIINNFSFIFERGNVYHIHGNNGSGKTTLIDLIIGVNKNFVGSILYNNKLIESIDMRHLNKYKIAFMEQTPKLIFSDGIYDNFFLGIQDADNDKMKHYCKQFGLEFENRKIVENNCLSGGEMQKIALIRTFLKNSDLIVLDEPTSALDGKAVDVLKNILQEEKENKIIIVISHDKRLLCESSKIVLLNDRSQNVSSRSNLQEI